MQGKQGDDGMNGTDGVPGSMGRPGKTVRHTFTHTIYVHVCVWCDVTQASSKTYPLSVFLQGLLFVHNVVFKGLTYCNDLGVLILESFI